MARNVPDRSSSKKAYRSKSGNDNPSAVRPELTVEKVTFFSRVKNWFLASETPRWFVIVGFMVSLGLSFLISDVLNQRNVTAEQRSEQIRSFLDSMVQFQVFSAAFATELVDQGTATTETRARLAQNLNDQYARLRIISQILPDSSRDAATAYGQRIIEMNDIVSKTKQFGDMKDYWSAASNLTVARNRLNTELQKAI
jgi:hypothetical protein